MLFDTVVRYVQQHNQGLEAENEAPPNTPYWRGTPYWCWVSFFNPTYAYCTILDVSLHYATFLQR